MRPGPAVIDTSVVVAGLITTDPDAPTARILDGMIRGGFPFLLSVELLAEYRSVLLRDRLRRHHGLSPGEIYTLLVAIAANGIVREPTGTASPAPDPRDQHLWDLLADVPGAILVTGDKALVRREAPATAVLEPRAYLKLLES